MKRRGWLLAGVGLVVAFCACGLMQVALNPSARAPRPTRPPVATQDASSETPPPPSPTLTRLPDSRPPAASSTSAPNTPTTTPAASTRTAVSSTPTPALIVASPPPAAAGYVCANGEACIKGNIGSNGNLYHLPGCPSYKVTKAEKMFTSESAAQAAGFTRAGNCP